ncbi:MAG: class I SAM-dependent methyltransferase [Burkholderiales bacterium]|nr:class I SAM-dependent methyltransferase [Burkholderiales bacterium]
MNISRISQQRGNYETNNYRNSRNTQVNREPFTSVKETVAQHEPTMNKRGFMHPLSKTSKQFVQYASSITLPVVDLGCAYGIATIEAAKAGASKVIACDMEQKHLDMLESRAAKLGLTSQITTRLGQFPNDLFFENNTVGAVLASLVLAYLTIEELATGLKNIFKWLIPGGKLFIVSYSIHIKEFANPRFQTEYQRRVDSLEKWPGYFEDFNKYSTMAEENANENSIPIRLHFFDILPLVKALEDVGFEVEVSQYLDGRSNGAVQDTWYDGREMLGVIARKLNYSKSKL